MKQPLTLSAFLQGLQQTVSQRFRPEVQARVPAKGSFKGSGKNPSTTVSARDRRLFFGLPQLQKRKKQNKTQRKSRSCLHIGSSKVAKRFQQIQARLPTSQPGSLSKARNNLTRKTKSTPALVRKMFQPELPARGFQQGSMLGSSSGFPEHAFCWHHSPAQRLKPNRIAVGN